MSEARDTGAVPAAVGSATAPGAPELPYAVPAAGLRRTTWLALLVLALAAGAAYHDSFHGPFVFDDEPAIQNNPDIRSFATTLRENPAVDTATAVGRPLLRVSLWANYALGGLDVRGYHAVNLLLHLAVAFTLFAFTRRLLASPRLAPRYAASAGPLALAIALLWTVHPLQSESVTYVVQRAEMLGALFYLLTLYAVVRCAEVSVSRRGRAWAVAAVLSCLLGMASKETLATAPLVALAMDRIFFSSSWSALWRTRRGLYLALAATWIFQALLVFASAGRKGTVGFALSIAWWEYALTQPYYLCRYLALSLWPGPLVFDYGSYVARGAGEIVPYLLVVLALGALTLFALWRRPVLGFLGLWFFALLGPTSSVVPVVTQTGAEHRMYLPLAAVVVLAVLGVHALARRHPPLGPRLAAVLLVLATLALGTRTVLRNRDYRSDVSLWKSVTEQRPINPRGFNNLGKVLADAGRPEEAIPNHEEAIRLAPGYAEAYNNLGVALAKAGLRDEAMARYDEALRLSPGFAEPHNNLGNALARSGRLPEALAHYEQALRLDPGFAEAHNSIGIALAKIGRNDEALAHYQSALRLDPEFAEAHNNLGKLLAAGGRPQFAIAHYHESLRIDPDFAEAHNNLGALLANLGRAGEAITHYEHSIRLSPQQAETHYNLGNALTQAGRLDDAVSAYERSLEFDPESAAVHNNLATALLAAGRPEAAISHYEMALRIDPDFIDALNNLAWLRSTSADPAHRDSDESLRLAERAVALSGGKKARFLGTLAAAQAAAGRFGDAAATAERAVEIARASGQKILIANLEKQLARYRAGETAP